MTTLFETLSPLSGGINALLTLISALTSAFIKQGQVNRLNKVATFSAYMSLQHLTKVFVFVFHDWLGLLSAMIAFGFIGTWIGGRLLHYLSEYRFDALFKWVLTFLSLRLLWMGIQQLGS